MTNIDTISVDDMYKISELIDSAVDARTKHKEPSKDTKERLGAFEEDITSIKENCHTHNTNNTLMRRDVEDIKTYIKEDLQWKKDFEAKMDQGFAKKWVEKVIVSLITIFALAALWIIFDKAGLPH